MPFDLLDFDFFDSEVLVLVYRPKDQQSKCTQPSAVDRCGRSSRSHRIAARIATVGYADLMYHAIPSHGYVNGTPRKALMNDVLGRLTSGQVRSAFASSRADGLRAAVVTAALMDNVLNHSLFSFPRLPHRSFSRGRSAGAGRGA